MIHSRNTRILLYIILLAIFAGLSNIQIKIGPLLCAILATVLLEIIIESFNTKKNGQV